MKDLHTGELGGPKFGKAFATTFALGVLRGKEKADERVGTYFVHPTSEAKAFQAFFTDTGPKANPFWQTGRDAGWLTGEVRLRWRSFFWFFLVFFGFFWFFFLRRRRRRPRLALHDNTSTLPLTIR